MSEALDIAVAKETAANALAAAAAQAAAEAADAKASADAAQDAAVVREAAAVAREAAAAAREAAAAEAERAAAAANEAAQQSSSEIEKLRAQLRDLQDKSQVERKEAVPASNGSMISLEEMVDFRTQLEKLAAARGAAEKLAAELMRELQKSGSEGGGGRAIVSAGHGTSSVEYHIEFTQEEHAEILRRRRELAPQGLSSKGTQSDGLQLALKDAAAQELLASIERDDAAGVADALQRGADLDTVADAEAGGGALHCAVRRGSEKAAACLLDSMQSHMAKQHHRFDLQLELLRHRSRRLVDGPDLSGRSPLAQLLRSSSPGEELAAKLLKAKADPLQRDACGATPFHECARSGHLQILKVLLQATRGAVLAAADSKGCTGLHYAAMEGRRETVELLLQVKADASSADEDGRRPVVLAAAAGHDEVAALLAKAAPEERTID